MLRTSRDKSPVPTSVEKMGFPHPTSSKLFRGNTNGHLSKKLGAERIPCRVAWTSTTLTKAWQGAVEGEMGHISADTSQQTETWPVLLSSHMWA